MFLLFIIHLTFVLVSGEDVGQPLFVTPYLKNGQIDEIQKLAKVTLEGTENITSYSGLFTVNETYNSNLFFWYFVSEEEPETAPVLLWQNGGPGASSLMGLLEEHGPIYVTDDLKLKFREYYWTKNHHVIYLESPVGVGYSFTNSSFGFAQNTRDEAVNVHEVLVQFFTMFPHLNKNPFFATGESYGGKYIPALSDIILKRKQLVNFKGIAIINGLTDPVLQMKGWGKYLYQQGFIDSQQKENFEKMENRCTEGIKNKDRFRILTTCLFIIHPFNKFTLFHKYTGYEYNYNILEDRASNASNYREEFVKLPKVRRALHVGNLNRSNHMGIFQVQYRLGFSMVDSEKEHIEELLNLGYPVLLFSGQLDVQIPYVTTVNYLKELKFQEADEYKTAKRQIWMVDGHVAGYLKQAGSLTEVMVIGAGHAVPMEQPKRAFDLITRFTHSGGKIILRQLEFKDM